MMPVKILVSTNSGTILVKSFVFSRFLPPANELWGKVIFSEACVENSVHKGWRGWVSAAGEVSALGEVPGPGWGVCFQGIACSQGCLLPERGACLGGGVCSQRGVCSGVPGGHPPRQLLLQAVHILLECILVYLKLDILDFSFKKLKIPLLYLNSKATDSQSGVITTTPTEPTVRGRHRKAFSNLQSCMTDSS